MLRPYRLLVVIAAMLFGTAADLMAYPSAGAAPAEGCRACHVNNDFRGKLVVKMLRVAPDGSKIFDDYIPSNNTVFIPIHKGSTTSYKMVLGNDTAGKADVVGWLWSLPSGVQTDLPNCIRRLEQGQPWTKYIDVDGQKDVAYHTVAGQTFYFDGTVTDQPLVGELRVALGKQGGGPTKLAGHIIRLIFIPTKGE